jgi:hypothetical protein
VNAPRLFTWFFRLFWLVAAICAVLVVTTTLGHCAEPTPAPADCASRPTWCAPGYVCLPTRCAAEASAQLELLTAETESLRKRRIRRWACTLGAGMGVTLQYNAGQASFDAAPIVGALTCGYTF